MSRLNELIEQLCPEDIAYVQLFEVASVLYGYPCDSSFFNSDGIGKPLVRIRDILNGITETYTTEVVPQEYIVSYGDLLIGMDGNFHVAEWKSDEAILC